MVDGAPYLEHGCRHCADNLAPQARRSCRHRCACHPATVQPIQAVMPRQRAEAAPRLSAQDQLAATDLDRGCHDRRGATRAEAALPALSSRPAPPTLADMSGVVADVAERLMAEFEGRVSPCVVSAVVCEVDRDLSGPAAAEARAELLERSARQRLTTTTS
jgi:hypothetical protein